MSAGSAITVRSGSRGWRAISALGPGALRAFLHIAGIELSEGTAFKTLSLFWSRKAPVFARDWSFAEVLEWAATRYKDRIFVEYANDRVSFEEMNRRCNRVAHALERAGIKQGQGVAVMMGNHTRFIETFFAIQKLGAYAVPVNAGLVGDGLAYIFNHSEAKAALLDHESAPKVQGIRAQIPGVGVFYVGTDEAPEGFAIPEGMRNYEELKQGAVDDEVNLGRKPDPEAPSLLLYTSGTTGLPKAVSTPYGNQRLKMISLAAHAQYAKDDKLYTCLPLFHANAMLVTVTSALWVGIPVRISKRFSASRFWKELTECGATAVNALGGMIPILLKTPPSPYDQTHKIKRVLSSACPKDAWNVFEERFNVDIWEAYGAVDGAGLAIANLGNGPIGSIGKLPRRGRLVDDAGKDVAAGVPGELIVKVGKRKEAGVEYFKNEKASNEKVKDGWLYTGDMMTKDERGFLYFVGRNTDSMRHRGENVSAYEVEKQVDSHPDVLESAAFGVPSEMSEDDIMVCVVPVEGRTIDPKEFLTFVRERLPKYAVPNYLEIVPEIPKTGTHRVIKSELKKRGVTPATIKLDGLLG